MSDATSERNETHPSVHTEPGRRLSEHVRILFGFYRPLSLFSSEPLSGETSPGPRRSRPSRSRARRHRPARHHQNSPVRLHTADSFILGTYPLRETDRIVSFLTRENGKKRGVARGARRAKSAFAGTLEPMTEARVVYYEKEGKDLVSINSADPIRPSFALSDDLDRALLLSALAESLETFVSESEPAEPFYRLARHVMDATLRRGPRPPCRRVLRRLDPEALRPAASRARVRRLRARDRGGRAAPLRGGASRIRRAGVPAERGAAAHPGRAPDAPRLPLRSARSGVASEGARRDRGGRAESEAALPRTRAEEPEGHRGSAGLRSSAPRLTAYGSRLTARSFPTPAVDFP